MKKFRAVTLLLALAMSVTVGLASCGGGETSTSVGGSSSSSSADSLSGNSSSSASSAHQHVYTEEVVPPTCTEGGYTLHKCACGDSYRDNETPAAGHSWGELIVDTPATWDADGTGHRVCTVCETVGPGEVIPKDTSAWHEIFPEGNED